MDEEAADAALLAVHSVAEDKDGAADRDADEDSSDDEEDDDSSEAGSGYPRAANGYAGGKSSSPMSRSPSGSSPPGGKEGGKEGSKAKRGFLDKKKRPRKFKSLTDERLRLKEEAMMIIDTEAAGG